MTHPRTTGLLAGLALLTLVPLGCGSRKKSNRQVQTVSAAAGAVSSDDHGGDAANATSQSLGLAAHGEIHFAGDTDWFQVELTRGKSYEFSAWSSESDMNPVLRLIDTDGTTTIDENDDRAAGDPHAKLEYVAGETGLHFCEVRHKNAGQPTGSYAFLAEEVPPNLGQFQSAGSLNEGRILFEAVALDDGRVLAVGGIAPLNSRQSLPVASVEIYDPLTDTWEYTDSIAPSVSAGLMLNSSGLALARTAPGSVKLASGEALIVGGWGGEVGRGLVPGPNFAQIQRNLTDAHLFDPQTNTFRRSQGELSVGREYPQGVLLPNGQALFVGGMEADMTVIPPVAASAAVDLYDPLTDSFSTLTPLPEGRFAMELAQVGGEVILVGGVDLLNLIRGGTPADSFPRDTLLEFQGNGFSAGPTMPGAFDVALNVHGDRAFIAGGGSNNTQLDPTAETFVYDPSTRTLSPGPLLPEPVGRAKMATIGQGPAQLINGGEGPGAPTPLCHVWDVRTNLILGQVRMFSPRTVHESITLQDGRILIIGGSSVAMLHDGILTSCEIYSR